MAEIQENIPNTIPLDQDMGTDAPAFRIDQKLHQILYKAETRPKLEPMPEEVLPEPIYPLHPDPVADDEA